MRISPKNAKAKYEFQREYFVRWESYPPDKDTWVPEEEMLVKASVKVSEYLESIGEIRSKPAKKKK